jgi:ubiquinone/menaquinone biosynthesis C-methylase UbiE
LSVLNFSIPLPQREDDPLPETISDRTRRVYDALAKIYPLSTYFFHSKAHTAAVRLSGIRNGDRVLEIATGSGELFRKLVEANPDGMTIGLDLSPKMSALTQQRIRRERPKAGAHCGAVDVRSLPFADGSFDSVVCCFLLELLGREDIYRTLNEVQRVLRPGGRFTLVVIGQNRPIFNQAYRLGGSIARAFWGRLVESEVPAMIRHCGMRVIDGHYIQQGYYPSRVLVSEHAGESVFARTEAQTAAAPK